MDLMGMPMGGEEKHNHIKRVKGTIIPNIFDVDLQLVEGLNIIAGENGTGKTYLLKYIQQNKVNQHVVEFAKNDNKLKNISAFNPKRNAARLLIEQAQRRVGESVYTQKESALSEFLNKQIQDDELQTIRPISEYLFMAYTECRDKDDLAPTEAARKVEEEYNEVLKKIFEDYAIEFQWDPSKRKADFYIKKGGFSLGPNLLSSGENAIISLIFALFHSKDVTQVYLIDEPEVHLNWQLEEKLFEFLDWFATTHKRQLIVVTHSRVCFVDKFLPKTKFLFWNTENKIEIAEYPTNEIVNQLSGDIVKIIGGVTAKRKLVYVEDRAHECVLAKIDELLNLDLEIKQLGSREEVVKFSKALRKLNIENIHFLIDHDNKPKRDYSETVNLIQLTKYCIENYFLDKEILSSIDRRNEVDKSKKPVEKLIVEAIKQVQDTGFVIIKKLIEQGGGLPNNEILDRVDASQFIKNLAKSLGFSSKEKLFEAFLEKLHERNQLREYFADLSPIIK